MDLQLCFNLDFHGLFVNLRGIMGIMEDILGLVMASDG